MRLRYWTAWSVSPSGSRSCRLQVSSSRSRTKDLSPRKKRKSASHTTSGTCISESYVLIRNQRILSLRKIAVTEVSPTPTPFRFFSILSTIARTPLSLAQVPPALSMTDKSQRRGRAIRAGLGRVTAAVRGAQVRVAHNEEAPLLSTETGMASGRCALKLRLVAGSPRWSSRFGRCGTFRARSVCGAFRSCAICAGTTSSPIGPRFQGPSTCFKWTSQDSWKGWICACTRTCN